jgi:hypothetical protein
LIKGDPSLGFSFQVRPDACFRGAASQIRHRFRHRRCENQLISRPPPGERDLHHSGPPKPPANLRTRITGNRATAGATVEAIMSTQDRMIHPAANDRSGLIELSEQQLDSVAGGTKTVDHASPSLFTHCCNGKHFPKVTLTV